MIKLMAKIRFDTPTGEREEILYHNIVSVEVEALDRGNVTDTINWGIYSNRGSISFVDKGGVVKGLLDNFSVRDVQVFIVGDESVEHLLATMNVSDFSYNIDTEQIDVELSDKIEDLQNKPFTRLYPFDAYSVYALAENIFTNQGGISIDDWSTATNISARELMTATKIYCPDIREKNVWAAITQLCETAMLRVYSDSYGKPYIAGVSSGSSLNVRPIIIRSRNILSQPRMTPRNKTRIINPKLSLTTRVKHFNSSLVNNQVVLKLYDDYIAPKADDIAIIYSDFDFIGNDKSLNPNVAIITQYNDIDGFGIHVVGLKFNPKPNIHSVTDVVTTGTLIDLEYEGYVKEANHPIDYHDLSVKYDINSANPELTVSFYIANAKVQPPQESVFQVKTDCVVSVIGDYYEDVFNEQSSSELNSTEIATNSLMQTENTMNGNDYGDWYINEISDRFGEGVVCCELECGFSDYYYGDGEIAKLTSKNIHDVFGKYEVVEPYVTRGGSEVPLATYDDGTPMRFIIIGIKYHYAGVAKQTLYLQEYREI